MHKPRLLLLMACLFSGISYGQRHFDLELKKQLDTIFADDQRYREVMVVQPGRERDSLAQVLRIEPDEVQDHFLKLQNHLDSVNLTKVQAIFAHVGYPGKRLVDTPENEAAYYVIQHSGKIEQYFPLIEKAGKQKDLPYTLVAMMQDRMLKDEGKEQIFGTQYAGIPVLDSATGQHKIYWFVWPIKNVENVNVLRKQAGFKNTVAADAAEMEIEYNAALSLDYIKKKYPWLLPKQ